MFRAVVKVVVVICSSLLSACGPELGSPPDPRATVTPSAAPGLVVASKKPDENAFELASSALRHIRAAQLAPDRIEEIGVAVAMIASTLVGSDDWITTGTLEAPKHPDGHWIYSRRPDDALVYIAPDDLEYRFQFTEIGGEPVTPEAFFASAHALAFNYSSDDEAFSLTSAHKNGRRERSLSGWTRMLGHLCTLESHDAHEHAEAVQSAWSGEMRCEDEAFAWSESLTRAQTLTTESREREFSYDWQKGSTAYRLPGAELHVYRREGQVADFIASGDLLRNDEKVGALIKERSRTDTGEVYTAWLITPNGRLQIGPEVGSPNTPPAQH